MLARRRREAERQKKLEDAFREADENGNGKITPQQMIKLFAANDCIGETADIFRCTCTVSHNFVSHERFLSVLQLRQVDLPFMPQFYMLPVRRVLKIKHQLFCQNN